MLAQGVRASHNDMIVPAVTMEFAQNPMLLPDDGEDDALIRGSVANEAIEEIDLPSILIPKGRGCEERVGNQESKKLTMIIKGV